MNEMEVENRKKVSKALPNMSAVAPITIRVSPPHTHTHLGNEKEETDSLPIFSAVAGRTLKMDALFYPKEHMLLFSFY